MRASRIDLMRIDDFRKSRNFVIEILVASIIVELESSRIL